MWMTAVCYILRELVRYVCPPQCKWNIARKCCRICKSCCREPLHLTAIFGIIAMEEFQRVLGLGGPSSLPPPPLSLGWDSNQYSPNYHKVFIMESNKHTLCGLLHCFTCSAAGLNIFPQLWRNIHKMMFYDLYYTSILKVWNSNMFKNG